MSIAIMNHALRFVYDVFSTIIAFFSSLGDAEHCDCELKFPCLGRHD